MKAYPFILYILLIMQGCDYQSSDVRPYALTPDVEPSEIYSVSANGIEIPVGSETSNDSVFETAAFSIKGNTTIEIMAKEKIKNYSIHPLSKKIDAQLDGKKLKFQISEPLKLMIKINHFQPLLIFVTPPETNIPNPTDSNVLYFGPGIHNAGRIRLKSNQTVYIADGAKVYGTLEGYEVRNVSIKGRGCLDGSKHTSWEKRIFGIYFDRSENITIEGVAIRNCYWWVTHFLLCKNVNISHINLFSFYRNNGGLMVDGCKDYTARNSIILTNDDCICPHALNAAGNGEPVAKNYLFENLALYNVISGNGIRIGASFETSRVTNWTFRNIDVLAHRNRAAILSDHSDWATVENLKFINFHDEQAYNHSIELLIDSTRYSCFTGYKNERGHIDHLYFVNFTTPGGDIVMKGYDEEHQIKNIYFYNSYIGDSRIDDPSDLQTNSFISNLHFIEDSSDLPRLDENKKVNASPTSQPDKLVIDNTDDRFMSVGFKLKSGNPGSVNGDYHEASVPEGFSNFKAAIYQPRIEGKYKISIHWGKFKDKATNARWIVYHQNGYNTKYFNQNNTDGWNHHGNYFLNADSYVRLILPGYFKITDGKVVADAVKFERIQAVSQ